MDEKELASLLEDVQKKVVESATTVLDERQKVQNEKLTAIEDSVKTVTEKVEKIEAMPVVRPFNINTGPKEFKGYQLDRQMEKIRNKAAKHPEDFPLFSDDERVEEYCRFMILAKNALTKKNDISAKMELLDFYQKAAMQEGTAAEGGYLVPDEYQMEIVRMSRAKSFALNECTVVEMGSDTKRVPTEASLVTVAWTAEEGTITEAEPTVGEVALSAKRLDGYSILSNELLADAAIDIVGWLTEQFAYAVGQELDNQVLLGSGDPCSGVLSGIAGYSVVMASGSTNWSAVTAINLSDMIQKIDEGYHDNLLFIWNKLVQHYIRTLRDDNGQFIYAKPGNGVPGTVWEVPYFQSAKAPSLSGAGLGMAVCGNFKYFYIGRRQGVMALDADPYGAFTTYQTRFRIVTRWALSIAQAKAFCRLVTAAS